MILDPETYTCPEHQADLTELVIEVLEDEGPPVAYLRLPGRPAAAGPAPFQVPVTCPGKSGTGAHQVVCSGTQTP